MASKLVLKVEEFWQKMEQQVTQMTPHRQKILREVQILHEVRYVLTAPDAGTHEKRIDSLLQAVESNALELQSRDVREYAAQLIDTYASHVGRTAFAKKQPKRFKALRTLAQRLPQEYVSGLKRLINEQQRTIRECQQEARAQAKAYRVQERDHNNLYRQCAKLYAEGYEAFETLPAVSLEKYVQAHKIARQVHKERAKDVAFNIGLLYGKEGDAGNAAAYSDAVKWLRRSWKDDFTQGLVKKIQERLDKTEVLPPSKLKRLYDIS